MHAPVRAIHVVPNIVEEANGHSYSVVRLCQALVDVGETVRLGVLDLGSLASNRPFVQTFPLGIGPRRLGCSPKMRRWLSAAAASGQVDIFHNHSLWMMPNVYPGWATRGTKCHLVVSPRGTLSKWALGVSANVKRMFWPLVQRPSLRSATCFHATSEGEFTDIRRAGFDQPVCIIPNGIDVPELEKPAFDGRRRLVFLGRIHPIKGVDLLLRAWSVVAPRFPDWDLLVAGPDNRGYLPRMKALADKLRLQRVAFSGALYGEQKLHAYRAADLFVLPSHSENFGMTVVEALAAGTPAIVTHGAPWQGLQDHDAGWWIEIGIDPLIACLDDALSRPREELIAHGIKGREWMLREFSWERIGAMMDQTYRWLLGGGEVAPWIRLD